MTTTERLLMLKTLLLTAALSLTTHLAVAQSEARGGRETPSAAEAASPSSELPWVLGEVRRIDTSARKVTLRHGNIPNLGMPAMTMVFQVAEVQWLAIFKVGDRVRFSVALVQGVYTVQRMERVE
jgi:Cu(I)/Ag(I) efflux system protein CusF